MSGRNYYALVAGLKEYALDADTKGFDARAIVGAILDEVSDSDAREVRLLYGYYDCENLAALRAGRKPRNPLGNLAPDELEEELRHPVRLPRRVADVVRAYGDPEGEEAEERDMNVRFEAALFEAYYAECARSSSRFLREWSLFDRNRRCGRAAAPQFGRRLRTEGRAALCRCGDRRGERGGEPAGEGAQARPDPLERGRGAGFVRLFRY